MKKVIVCPDSFKGSLTAEEVATTIKQIITQSYPEMDVVTIPLADGGEGCADIISSRGFPYRKNLLSIDALGNPIETFYLKDPTGKKAFIESALSIGLPLIKPAYRNPLKTSSKGLGLIIKDAIEDGATEISVALGGSATCDGGMGMLSALGFQFPNDKGEILCPNGENTAYIQKILPSPISKLKNIRFNVICDVENPLLGEYGAVNVFAPQKGAKKEDLPILENGLKNLMQKTYEAGFGISDDELKKGMGAAGGLGFSFMTFLNANHLKGIDFIMEILDFENQIKDANLIITGEGKIDSQSLMGKVVSGVLNQTSRIFKASQREIPVIAITGSLDDSDSIKKSPLKAIFTILDPTLSLQENMSPEQTRQNIKRTLMSKKFHSLLTNLKLL